MSRGAAADQLTTPSKHIFITFVTQTNGIKTPVMSSQPLSEQSVRVNRTWKGEKWEGRNTVTGICTNSGALFLLMTLCSHGNINCLGMKYDAWKVIFGFTFGLEQVQHIESLGNYAVAIRRPPSIFQTIEDPLVIVDAAMRGEEDMVLNILRANPSYLLKEAAVKNSVSVEYKVTPLQAAVMANDVQMIEKMHEHFARLDNGLAEMHRQIKAIYTESLERYCEMQKEKEGEKTQSHLKMYSDALASNNLNAILEAHHKAQEDNAFDFQPYVDAICNASPAELDNVMALINAQTPEQIATAIAHTGVAATQTDAARAKPFDQLTLVEKLNRFREEFVKHMQQEMIFNPNHILTGLSHNEKIWADVDASRIADPNYKKRSVIFSQLAGWAQRNAAEPVKQDIRQGTWYLTQENEPRSRANRFNDIDSHTNNNSLVDVSLVASSVVDGLGYKFARGGVRGEVWRGAGLAHFFKTYVEQKQQAFRTYYAAFTSTSSRAPVCNSVMR